MGGIGIICGDEEVLVINGVVRLSLEGGVAPVPWDVGEGQKESWM